MKTATLESKFPLLAVENGCIISKDAPFPRPQSSPDFVARHSKAV